MFGAAEDEVDPVRHLVGTALVWGGLPEKDALYNARAIWSRTNTTHIP